jgi:uncharacterized protein YfcZ (UPF0381/DUF406 family)
MKSEKKEPEKPIVYIVHCVDVEGPMTETVEATWERIRDEDKIHISLEPSLDNLKKIQEGKLDLGLSREVMIKLQNKYSPENLAYLTSWEEVDKSIKNSISLEFRKRYCDSEGGLYKYSWFIYDHYGFINNPRFHVTGIHSIFDHYLKLFSDKPKFINDGIYWHYHHVPISGNAMEWNTNWILNGVYEEILSRRIIERQWFPSVFRAGGFIETNDLSNWMEMFIPFDYSCRTPLLSEDQLKNEVFDWRFAPKKWGYYHPDWYDYRRKGAMRRYIFRCLDIKSRILSLNKEDVTQSFEQAKRDGKSVLAYYNHDYRDMEKDVCYVYSLIKKVEKKYPDVKWKFVNALEAAKYFIGIDDNAPNFTITLKGNFLEISSDCDLFGPQPFFAIKENGKFFRDNLIQENSRNWTYVFRRPQEVESFGVAGNSKMGNTGIKVHIGRLKTNPEGNP